MTGEDGLAHQRKSLESPLTVESPHKEATMTKKELAKTIAEEVGLPVVQVLEIVQKAYDGIIEALVSEGRIELRNFGVFQVKERKPRKARNPKTGEAVDVPGKLAVVFKAGKEMEERVWQKALSRVEDRPTTVGMPSILP